MRSLGQLWDFGTERRDLLGFGRLVGEALFENGLCIRLDVCKLVMVSHMKAHFAACAVASRNGLDRDRRDETDRTFVGEAPLVYKVARGRVGNVTEE